MIVCDVFFFKQKTAYEMRISEWSSDVCSSDLRTKKPLVGPGGDGLIGMADHVAHAHIVRILACQQRGTCGAAPSRIVKAAETQPVICQFIEVWRLDFDAVTTEIRIAHIIG